MFYFREKRICAVCGQHLLNGEILEIHYVIPCIKGGTDKIPNLKLLHIECHKQVTHFKNEKLRVRWIKNKIITD